MSYQIIDYGKLSKRDVMKFDPRVAIARHMCWQPNYNPTSLATWSIPEPVNYNRAVRAAKPIECKFIENSIFYRDERTGSWWSVYYLLDPVKDQFEEWVKLQDIEIYWFNSKTPRVREQQRLMFSRANSDITDNERLFQMGYYETFGSKYFADADSKSMSVRLGPIRDKVYDRAEEGLDSKFDFDADQL